MKNSNVNKLEEIIMLNPNIKAILDRAPRLGLENYYLAAGCIAHTVWNYLCGLDITNGIKDYDLVYFDKNNSYEAEDEVIKMGNELFGDLDIDVEIRNEARVHLWYEKHFGESIEPYKSLEEAVSTFPTTATAIGVRRINGKLIVYAPKGFDDLFNLTMRANKAQITEEIYLNKVKRWSKVWTKLKVVQWD